MQQALVKTMRRHGLRLMTLPPAVARQRSDALQRSARPPRRLQLRSDAGGLELEPPTVRAPFELLYFHGGGYCFGSPESYAAQLGRLAQLLQCRVTVPRYRLAPEHPFPAALDDAVAAHRAIVARLGGADRLIVAGDSAGGALALRAVIEARDAKQPTAAGVILVSPWCDLAAATGSVIDNAGIDWGDRAYLEHWSRLYLAGASASDPPASPLRADLRGLPPLRVLVGGGELVRDQSLELVSAAAGAGVDARIEVTPGMVHGFWMLGPVFPARAALQQLATWAGELTRHSVAKV